MTAKNASGRYTSETTVETDAAMTPAAEQMETVAPRTDAVQTDAVQTDAVQTDAMLMSAETIEGEPVVEPTEQEARLLKAKHIIYKATVWSAAAGAIPVPILDFGAVGAVQTKLVRDLAALYGETIRSELAHSVVALALGVLLPSQLSNLVSSAAKSIPVVGTILGTISFSGSAAAASYAIGKVFVEHLESGGTIGNFDVDHTRETLKREFRLARLKRVAA